MKPAAQDASGSLEVAAMPRIRGESSLLPHRQPFLYLTAALVTGILLERGTEPPLWIVWPLAGVSFVFSITMVIGKKRAAGSVLLLSLAMAGALLSQQERAVAPSRLKSLFEAHRITPARPVELEGVLRTPPEPGPDIRYLDVEAEAIRFRDQVIPATGGARLMIAIREPETAREFESLALDYGSRVRVLVRLEHARTYNNPGSPDFNEFLERHDYDLKGTIKSPLLIQRIGRAKVNPALAVLYTLRLKLIGEIDSCFKQPVAGTLKAMLAGNQYYLDRETIERLRQASTFHALVISGMHIALIAWAMLGLGNLWGLRRTTQRRQTLLVLLSILVLWSYTLMVGLAAPVTRGAAMITVGLIGPLLFRRSASINTVALAAFVMLALKPALVGDPGFQLSFAAVAGITALTLPFAEKLRQIGEWRPSARAPHPPSCSRAVRYAADTLFWNTRRFEAEMRHAAVRYRMKKARAARVAGRLHVQALLRSVTLLVITSSSIQLTTLPLMAMYFNRAAPVGVLLNIAAGLLTAILMLGGLAVLAAGAVSVWLASKLSLIVTAAHYLLVHSVVPFAHFPGATFRVAHYEGWPSIIYALYFVPLAMLVVAIDRWRPVDRYFPIDRLTERKALRRVAKKASEAEPRDRTIRRRVFAWACLLLLVVSSGAVLGPAPAAPTGKLAVHFLDVGQGDAALVVFPKGATMLVDGGGEIRFNRSEQNREGSEEEFPGGGFSVGEAVTSRFVWSLGRTRVDYVLATHADADHIDGASDVVRNFGVGQAIVGHVPDSDTEFNRFEGAIEQRRVPLAFVNAGDRFDVDGVTVEVLWPPSPTQVPVTSGNNDSVVLRLVYGSVAVLLTGDIEQAAEHELVATGVDLRSDVLKVPHHGSKTSSTEAFIDAVQPRCAVISVGERSRFGHPHTSVVSRYVGRGVRLFQTGRDGTVTVETDGRTLEVRTFRKKE
ncbi:MAG: ComEC/Rec2 family competence protein [Acidobacteriota bacterium]